MTVIHRDWTVSYCNVVNGELTIQYWLNGKIKQIELGDTFSTLSEFDLKAIAHLIKKKD